MSESIGLAAMHVHGELEPYRFQRRELRPTDIHVDLMYSGVCHTDIHMLDNDWGYSLYPMVPGHEMIGRATAVGSAVTKFKPGDLVGVGPFIDSCRTCKPCTTGHDQFCVETTVQSYGFPDRITGEITQGGFASDYVIDEYFAFKIPENLDPAAAAPLLCAGMSMYAPLKKMGVKPGIKVGIVGLGGLGHVGVKFAKAMGAEVVVLSTSPNKSADAKRLGARLVVTTDPEAVAAEKGTFNLIIDTVTANHDIDQLLDLLVIEGTMCLVGLPSAPLSVRAFSLVFYNHTLSGSGGADSRETQEMLDFAGKHGIVADVEMIKPEEINTALARLKRNDVKYRFVIDVRGMR